MKLLKQIFYDVRRGFAGYYRFFPVIVAVSAVLTIVFYHMYQEIPDISFADAVLRMFRGMEEFRPELNRPFELTEAFLIWNVILSYIIGIYPMKELHTTAENCLVRTGERQIWWTAKCVWNLFTVLFFYLSIYTGIVLVAIWNDGMNLSVNPVIFLKLFRTELQKSQECYIMLQVLLLPGLSSMAISILQMTVTMIAGEAVGYMCTLLICVLSAYWMTPFLPANAGMVYRYAAVNPKGIQFMLPAGVCLGIIIVSYFVGRAYFEEKDILR